MAVVESIEFAEVVMTIHYMVIVKKTISMAVLVAIIYRVEAVLMNYMVM